VDEAVTASTSLAYSLSAINALLALKMAECQLLVATQLRGNDSLHSCRTPSSSWIRGPGDDSISTHAGTKQQPSFESTPRLRGSKGASPRDMDLLNNSGRMETWQCHDSLGLVYQNWAQTPGTGLGPFRLVSVYRRGRRPLSAAGASIPHPRKSLPGFCTLTLHCRSRSPHRCWGGGCLQSQAPSAILCVRPGTTPGVRDSTTRTTICGILHNNGLGCSQNTAG
jgi:hypothetical protein